MQLLDLDDLAAILKRSPDTIKKDMKRNPSAVPPRVVIPGARALRWRQDVVDNWISELAVVSGPLDDADLLDDKGNNHG